jgi:hypothetical protein
MRSSPWFLRPDAPKQKTLPLEQRASRLLAAEGVGRLLGERRDAE